MHNKYWLRRVNTRFICFIGDTTYYTCNSYIFVQNHENAFSIKKKGSLESSKYNQKGIFQLKSRGTELVPIFCLLTWPSKYNFDLVDDLENSTYYQKLDSAVKNTSKEGVTFVRICICSKTSIFNFWLEVVHLTLHMILIHKTNSTNILFRQN